MYIINKVWCISSAGTSDWTSTCAQKSRSSFSWII